MRDIVGVFFFRIRNTYPKFECCRGVQNICDFIKHSVVSCNPFNMHTSLLIA